MLSTACNLLTNYRCTSRVVGHAGVHVNGGYIDNHYIDNDYVDNDYVDNDYVEFLSDTYDEHPKLTETSLFSFKQGFD